MKTEKTSAWSSFSGLVKGLLVKYGVVSESTYDTAVELGASAFDLSKTIKEGGLSGVALGTAEYIGGPLGVIAGEATSGAFFSFIMALDLPFLSHTAKRPFR